MEVNGSSRKDKRNSVYVHVCVCACVLCGCFFLSPAVRGHICPGVL